jgi:molybdopterin biosynthesis enzyme
VWSDRPFIVGRIEGKFIVLLSGNILSMAVLGVS